MELKVWVEGIQRIVCGVNETTTCQDVVFALAHATGKIGRFTLVERWRNNERLLAPQEFPLRILNKWGEYSNDIQFILRQSDPAKTPAKPLSNPSHTRQSPEQSAGSPAGNPVGVVRGVPQSKASEEPPPLKDVPPYREPPPPYRSPPRPTQHTPPTNQAPPTKHAPPTHQVPPAHAPLSQHAPSTQRPSTHRDVLEPVAYNPQYRELVTLVNHQRERLTSQQADLIKYDAEIGFWESKGREQERQAELLQQQITTADSQLRLSTEQVQALSHVEEESELARQTEKRLLAEISSWRAKLGECEAELGACHGRVRRLIEEVQAAGMQHDARNAMERAMLGEIDSLQTQVQHAKHASGMNHVTAETLKREVGVLESAILEKKRQVEQLVQQMKEANLQSLAGSSDELRHLLDGSCKAGSTRRIIGSPRQLENAAPTNRNPHGVWV